MPADFSTVAQVRAASGLEPVNLTASLDPGSFEVEGSVMGEFQNGVACCSS